MFVSVLAVLYLDLQIGLLYFFILSDLLIELCQSLSDLVIHLLKPTQTTEVEFQVGPQAEYYCSICPCVCVTLCSSIFSFSTTLACLSDTLVSLDIALAASDSSLFRLADTSASICSFWLFSAPIKFKKKFVQDGEA